MASDAADLIIEGRIATLRGRHGFGWVDAIALRAGRVSAVGSVADVRQHLAPATTRWRLPPAQIVTPTFTDAHLHLISAALSAPQPDLTGLNPIEVGAAIAREHRARLEAGDAEGWLLGHGWSFAALGQQPDAAWLDIAAPGRRVALWSHDHHSRWLSSTALRSAGLVDLDDPPAGRIGRDRDSRPTGVMYEAAAGLVDAAIPAPDDRTVETTIGVYARTLARLGVTSVHDPGGLGPDPELRSGPVSYRAMAGRGRLPLRVTASVREEQLERAIEMGFRSGRGVEDMDQGRYLDGWLKLFSDGALGSRTAALLEPYESDADAGPPPGGPRGLPLRSAAELADAASRAATAGIASQIHAIGDAAVRTVLDVIEGLPAVAGAMHRVEHAQLVHPTDVARFGSAGIPASVQPCHLISDVVAMQRSWGARAAAAFPLAALDAAGALLPFGTDAPVESADPWPGLAAAVYRRGPGTQPRAAFHPEQAISLERALRAACLDGPRSAGVDDLGHLDVGARADLMVVPAHILDGPAEPGAIGTARPAATLLDGIVIHDTPDFDP